LATGGNAIAIGPRGLVQWYRVPNAASLTISGQSDWKLFDGDLALVASGGDAPVTTHAPTGAYVAIFGAPGTTAQVELS